VIEEGQTSRHDPRHHRTDEAVREANPNARHGSVRAARPRTNLFYHGELAAWRRTAAQNLPDPLGLAVGQTMTQRRSSHSGELLPGVGGSSWLQQCHPVLPSGAAPRPFTAAMLRHARRRIKQHFPHTAVWCRTRRPLPQRAQPSQCVAGAPRPRQYWVTLLTELPPDAAVEVLQNGCFAAGVIVCPTASPRGSGRFLGAVSTPMPPISSVIEEIVRGRGCPN